MLAQSADGRLHRGAGGQAIVDHDDCLVAKGNPGPIGVVGLVPPFELDALARGDPFRHFR